MKLDLAQPGNYSCLKQVPAQLGASRTGDTLVPFRTSAGGQHRVGWPPAVSVMLSVCRGHLMTTCRPDGGVVALAQQNALEEQNAFALAQILSNRLRKYRKLNRQVSELRI